MGGLQTDFIYPREMPDIFRGTQVTLIGRYSNANDLRAATLRLTGRTGRQARTFTYNDINFPLTEERNDFLPRLWATRRVGWLMEQVRSNGEQKELTDEIVDLGTRYGIVTPYTSYLAVEPEMSIDGQNAVRVTRDDRRTRGAQANRPEANWGIGGTGSGAGARDTSAAPPPPAPSKEDAKAKTGAVAIRESKRARAQQEVLRVESDAPSESVRKVGDKTFYLREGAWTDSEFKQEAKLPESALDFGSDEYFVLLRREPQLARFFSLGERVVVVYKGRVYRVNSKP